jgi:hypothetical protein
MEIHFCPPVKDMPVHPALAWAFLVPVARRTDHPGGAAGRARPTDPLSTDWGCRCCNQPIGDRDSSEWRETFGDGFEPWLREERPADYCDLCIADFVGIPYEIETCELPECFRRKSNGRP